MPRTVAQVMPTQRHPVYEHVLKTDTDTFVWRRDDYPWIRNVWNIHPEYEIHLIRKAQGVALIGDYIGHFEPGDLTIVGSGLPHDWVTAVAPGEVIEGRDIVLQFDPHRVKGAAALMPELSRLDPFLTLALRGLAFFGETQRLGAQILETIGSSTGVERVSLFLRLLHVLSLSTEVEVLSSADFAPDLNPATLSTIQRMLTYVFENFQTDIKLSELAGMANMSESQFSRFFKRNSGNTFMEHVTTLRIGRACKMLSEGVTPITEICFQIGYLNISNFNRVFRATKGMTPSQYRQLARQRMG